MLDHRLSTASHLRDGDTVQDPGLRRDERVAHAFFTRVGGVSTGLYRGLNAGIGSHDAPEAVHENRRRAVHFLGLEGARLATPWQTHSPDAVVATDPFGGERPKADAVVTATRGLAVGVVTADCGPILFADAEAGVVAAAHAGWRGAVGGVLERTVETMENLGAERGRIQAVLGPCITQPNYEVGADMAETFLREDARNARFFAPGAAPDKRLFDLPAFILARLERLGLAARFVGRCTYGEEDAFFSFRRTTHRGEPDYGRQLSAIALA
ncbi:peptidoglycan editing factor PgeF [Aureimonas flava]|uniref:Purine nucleoside phosphorylase n=1 Tax=Aureimonas flava TaxID=2320271 RepID=A0A3A1WQ17_9HYPH|nr:peptidoglycan editing factor PgeF [Aureimonas flava]RIY02092.1 peptidoglycan editing factor PgeF [Aureimonas flava]